MEDGNMPYSGAALVGLDPVEEPEHELVEDSERAGPDLPARFESRCRACAEPIHIGDVICPTDDGVFEHAYHHRDPDEPDELRRYLATLRPRRA
jgi:hypothetical protein